MHLRGREAGGADASRSVHEVKIIVKKARLQNRIHSVTCELREKSRNEVCPELSLSDVVVSGRAVRQAGERDPWRGRSEHPKGDGYRTGEMKQRPRRAPSGPYSAWKGTSLERQSWG